MIRHWLIERVRKEPENSEKKWKERFFSESPTGRLEPRLRPELVDYLVRSPLLTNMREFDHVLLKSLQTSQGDRLALPEGMALQPSLLPPPKVSADGEPTKEAMVQCLDSVRWNISKAAKKMGIGRTKFYELMEKYGLGPKKEK